MIERRIYTDPTGTRYMMDITKADAKRVQGVCYPFAPTDSISGVGRPGQLFNITRKDYDAHTTEAPASLKEDTTELVRLKLSGVMVSGDEQSADRERMDKESAEAIAAEYNRLAYLAASDTEAKAADWAGGCWGVEVQTEYVHPNTGALVYLTVGSDDEGDTLAQYSTYSEGDFDGGTGEPTDDYRALHLYHARTQEIAVWLLINANQPPHTL